MQLVRDAAAKAAAKSIAQEAAAVASASASASAVDGDASARASNENDDENEEGDDGADSADEREEVLSSFRDLLYGGVPDTGVRRRRVLPRARGVATARANARAVAGGRGGGRRGGGGAAAAAAAPTNPFMGLPLLAPPHVTRTERLAKDVASYAVESLRAHSRALNAARGDALARDGGAAAAGGGGGRKTQTHSCHRATRWRSPRRRSRRSRPRRRRRRWKLRASSATPRRRR